MENAFREREQLLDIFELGRWQNELVESFSHGMKQRLVMSAAFLHRPKAVLVDEPMVGLDPRGARLIKDVFRRMTDRQFNTTVYVLLIAAGSALLLGVGVALFVVSRRRRVTFTA